jgi:hypothetical protein
MLVVSIPIAWANILNPITYEQNREGKMETNFCQYLPGVSFLEASIYAWTFAKKTPSDLSISQNFATHLIHLER